jgi:transcriptional regulator GlxA family with amidase domain
VRSRTVALVVFDGVQGLDVFGPADVFYFANHHAEQAGEGPPPYAVELVARTPGPVRTAAGPALVAGRSIDDPDLRPDVLLVAGGLGTPEVATDRAFVDALRSLASRSAEVGSVCTGAVLLAEAGLLDGRRATTHWALADQLARGHPTVRMEPDRIYVFDGVWTSAGVTAGIDLALQLVRRHHGAAMAADAARNLVVYLQRAGGQQQFSTHLAAHGSDDDVVAELMAYVADHPEADLSVPALARRARMSERSFHRLFTAEVGISPGRYVERARVDAARARLENSKDGLSAIARRCGFASQETFVRTFRRVVGVSPTEYRRRFSIPHALR